MKRKQIIVDTSVISLLADKKKTGSGALKQKEFYRRESEGCTWNITNEILKEVKNIQSRDGKVRLYQWCLELLAKEKADTLSHMDLPHIANRPDVKQALKQHDKSQSDRRDRKNIHRAIHEEFPFLCHDNTLYKRVRKLAGLTIISWYGIPRKGQRTVRRSRSGDKLDW